MKEILIISGKGGCGKTSLCAGFAKLAKSAVLVDCDVDASDLHLLLKPEIIKKEVFIAGELPSLDEEKCIRCGKCKEYCRLNAITFAEHELPVFHENACEGCKVCTIVCPTKAITMVPRTCGEWMKSQTCAGMMFHARLLPGGENSGKLIAEIRKAAREEAKREKQDLLLSDGPPGIGCPVISSITGVDMAVIITEPTLSGLHDLKRTIQMAREFEVEIRVIINKYDLNSEMADKIQKACEKNGIQVIGKMPFDPIFNSSLREGKTIIDFPDSEPAKILASIWKQIDPSKEKGKRK
ncbi:MAG: P-loop NTPase [Lentisphaeria bacterium]